MKRPSIEEIHEVMKKSGMIIFEKPYDATMGAIRTKDNRSNKFNDWGFMSMFTDGGGVLSIVAEVTTDAGLYFRENPISADGTAIIMHGVQHRGAYQYQNPRIDGKHGHKGNEAFKQIADMKYWRDADRNSYINFNGEVCVDNFTTNGHDMGKLGTDGEVNKWSAGCWGSENEVMDFFYEMAIIQDEHGNGDILSFALLHENMF